MSLLSFTFGFFLYISFLNRNSASLLSAKTTRRSYIKTLTHTPFACSQNKICSFLRQNHQLQQQKLQHALRAINPPLCSPHNYYSAPLRLGWELSIYSPPATKSCSCI